MSNCDCAGKIARLSCRYRLPRGRCALTVAAEHPDGLSRARVAELLGLSVGTVAAVERSALAKLRRGPRGKLLRSLL